MIDESHDAIITIDKDSRVLNWNKVAENIFGWSFEEARSWDLAELVIPPESREAHRRGIRRFLETGEGSILGQHLEVAAMKKGGVRFPIEMTVASIKLERCQTFTATVRDLTTEKILQAQNLKYAHEVAKLYKMEKTQRHAIEIANRQLREFSEQIQEKVLEIEQSYLKTLNSLSIAAEYRDEETGAHIRRLSKYGEILALSYGLEGELASNIALAAPMHDIGKIGISDNILLKPGKLTDAEFESMKAHASIGGNILADFDAPIITLAREIALAHHEKWNGKGYPAGLSGWNIPISGRIIALVDCFDALTSRRPYKEAWPVEQALELIRREKGESFDPDVVSAFERCFPEIALTREYLAREVAAAPGVGSQSPAR